ncbi:sodium channel subunit beta-2-like [Pseudophryne corroboree]|uniref:sodium channel subunit beta-2-like n=1 Tax=Pseudophryne corroboree TaxID=495146 RepID=UPI0030815747
MQIRGSGLEVTVPASQSALLHTQTLLPCTFRVDSPPVNLQFLAIFWYLEDKELLRYDNKEKVSSPTMAIDEQAVKQGNASLSIHNVTISDQGTYKCLVIDSPDRQHKEFQLHILGMVSRSWWLKSRQSEIPQRHPSFQNPDGSQ